MAVDHENAIGPMTARKTFIAGQQPGILRGTMF